MQWEQIGQISNIHTFFLILSATQSKDAQFLIHNLDQSLNVSSLVNNQFLKN